MLVSVLGLEHITLSTVSSTLSDADIEFCSQFLIKLEIASHDLHSLPVYRIITGLPLHIRHPRAVALREMIKYPHYDTLSFLTGEEIAYLYLLFYQAGKPYGKEAWKFYNGVSKTLFPNMKHAFDMLWALGVLDLVTCQRNKFILSPLGYCLVHSIYYDRQEYLEDLQIMRAEMLDAFDIPVKGPKK